ncbi:hypothetical protein [Paenibacillus sp. 1001270B_150601_E10]|uniref:hypothetical protein n=1 Tax=Paenibacillus sp. 1001270B_150601_E10 TaxID=2787079 RepID=UPI001E3A795E|nr:hypothetical protein [Paenibacillus sp. 1001270B_150601_E10]
MDRSSPDLSIFRCKPALVPFYTRGGWEPISEAVLVGGIRQAPFRSDSLGLTVMARFHSDNAKQNRETFERADIYLDLGEGQLW